MSLTRRFLSLASVSERRDKQRSRNIETSWRKGRTPSPGWHPRTTFSPTTLRGYSLGGQPRPSAARSGRHTSMQDTVHDTGELVRFGERFGRFAPVWLAATKSKSPDGEEINNNLVDLVDILSRDKIADVGALALARARALQFLPSERIDQIDQIPNDHPAVPRISFGSKGPNATNGPTKSALNWLVGGFERGWSA